MINFAWLFDDNTVNWIDEILYNQSPLQAVVVLGLICSVGLGLGKLKAFGISLGVTFVFFAGIVAGHIGLNIDGQMLHYAENFGLGSCCRPDRTWKRY